MYKIMTATDAFLWPRKTNSAKVRMKFINRAMREIRKAAKSGETKIVIWADLPNSADVAMAASFLSSLGYKVVIYEKLYDHRFTYYLYIYWVREESFKYIKNSIKIASELAKNP